VRRPDAGLTLVELLITLLVASLVAASTFTFVAGQQRIYDTQSKLVNVQQSLAVTTEMMVRMVRSAGSGMSGCVRGDSDGFGLGVDTGAPSPVAPALPLTGAPATGVRAYLRGVGNIRIPPLWISNDAAGGPDTLTVAYGSGTFGTWKDTDLGQAIPLGKPTSAIRLPATASSMFRKDEFILLFEDGGEPTRGAPFYNDRGCSLFQVTDVDGMANELLHASTSDWNPASDFLGADLVPFEYPADTGVRQFGALNWIRFAIDPAGGVGGVPALTMQRLDDGSAPQVLAEGIVDLQVAYACDNSPDDGVLREGPDRKADEWVLNVKDDPIPAGCGRPEAIRLTLVARSLTTDSLLSDITTNVKPASEDAATPSGPDSFRYRTITATVYPRN
jgi:prepilin-type N-terminal cleavage/methylation domain-containing protein